MANVTLRRNEGSNVPARINRPQLGVLDPFRVMESLLGFDPFQELGPVFGQGRAGQMFVPAFEVIETKDAYIFKADMPGVKESDLDISLTGDHLTVSGKRETETREDVQNYYAYERVYGSFTRSFTLPTGADPNNIKADLRDGVLSLILPKRPEMQPRRISVGKSGGAPTGQGGGKASA